jgi:Protein of unknown function (DUF551)
MSEWISVKDRLPDWNQKVLVCESGEVYPAYFQVARGSWAGHIPAHFRSYGDEGRFNEATHWMNMPNPPEIDNDLPADRCGGDGTYPNA